MRLDRILAEAGWGSRKDMQTAIRRGRVTVNGTAETRPEKNADPRLDSVLIDGEDIDWRERYYIMMNKPLGVVSSTDEPGERTVIDLLPERYISMGLFPAGRLDKDATGLLLLTNDGALAHKWLSPKNHVDKRYIVTVEGMISQETVRSFVEGVVLGDGTACLPAKLEILEERKALVTLREGKYHQIKRMMAANGCHVTAIHRISMGPLQLDDSLDYGGWKRIEKPE